MVSNSKIDKIGNLLKKNTELGSEDLKIILSWRNSFSPSLDYYHSKLKSKINDSGLITLSRRLKRIESIQIKLKRFSTMRLSTLQDIAGLRVVLYNHELLQKAFLNLRGLPNKHTLKRLDNYYHYPKDDGYRGIHLVYQDSKNMMVEIQLRSELQHIWATAVEIYGELQNTSFKTGEGNEKWKEFFNLLSSHFALKENCTPLKEHLTLAENQIKSKLKTIIKELKVIEQLNATTNSIEVISKKYNEIGRMGKYAILELNLNDRKTYIEYFNKKDVSKAIEIYTQKELQYKNDKNINIVFVNVDDVEKIQKSYPNYFLDTRKLLEILSKIILDQF